MIVFFSACTTILVLLTIAYLKQPRVRRPRSDHFDGSRFFNPTRPPYYEKPSFLTLASRLASHSASTWPKQAPVRKSKPARYILGGNVEATMIGHATVLLQTCGINILTDPIYQTHASPVPPIGPQRISVPGVAFDDLPPLDLILISHNHYDHLDLATLTQLVQRDNPLIIAGIGNEKTLAQTGSTKITTMDWEDTFSFDQQISITCERAYHWSRRNLFDYNKSLWCGYSIKTPYGSYYFAGDTGYGDGSHFEYTGTMRGPFRLAMIPIGAYLPRNILQEQHISPHEAVVAHQKLNALKSMAIHFDTFKLADESYGEAVKDLRHATRLKQIPDEEFIALRAGEKAVLPGDSFVADNQAPAYKTLPN